MDEDKSPTLDVHMNDAMYRVWTDYMLKVGAQRDELLAALKTIARDLDPMIDWQSKALDIARAAIEKVEGSGEKGLHVLS